MTQQAQKRIALGMGAAALWSVCLIWFGLSWQPAIGRESALALSFLPGGIVIAALIARLAAARFLDAEIRDGQPFREGSAQALTQRVLSNSIEQFALAVAIWPAVAVILGPGPVLALGLSFGLTRASFWAGYAAAPPLRAFGFAAGFYPTLLAAVVVLWRLIF